MARVTYGSGITELAGSIGGVTYQKNASGNIAKLRSNPIVNPTPLQAGYQNNMARLVAFWPTLSQANKDAWNDLAAAHLHTTPWGEEKTLSGYQWFISINLNRLLKYTTFLNSPPVWRVYPSPDVFTLVATVDYLRCEWAATYTPEGTLKFYLTLPLRQSSLKLRRSLFYVGDGCYRTPTDLYDLTTHFESLTGVTWAAFYASADCSIICRITDNTFHYGLSSSFTSAIVKIG